MTSTPAAETNHISVDSHAHMAPRALLERLATSNTDFPHIAVTPHESTFRVAFNGGEPTRPIAPGLTDLARRRAWMADNGIGHQLVGGWLDIFGYDLPADEGVAWAEALTAALRAEVGDDRSLTVLGTVALQDPERAAAAVKSQTAEGLPGIMIATRAGGRELDDPAFEPLWAAADEAEAIVYLHPGFGGASDRYQEFGLVNGLARLEDTTVTLARLLYAGVPAAWPRLKFVIAHGGAALPYVLGRLVRNHTINPDTTKDQLESFARLYFDSVVFDADALRFLVTKVGADRVLLGSDYPFPIGDLQPRGVLAELSDQERAVIERGTGRLLAGGRS